MYNEQSVKYSNEQYLLVVRKIDDWEENVELYHIYRERA